MDTNNQPDLRNYIPMVVTVLVVLFAIFIGAFILPWKMIKWGSVELTQDNTITVTGTATSQKANEVATFNASLTSQNEDKQKAVDEVSTNAKKLVDSVIAFGVPKEDIKTQSVNVYQLQEPYMRDGVTDYRPGDWSASLSIDIKLKDIAKAEELAALLSGANISGLYGPSFQLDENNTESTELVKLAMDNARDKAEKIAAASGRQLGQVLNVSESNTYSPMPYGYGEMMVDAKSAIPLEPGTSSVSKSLTVVYEIK